MPHPASAADAEGDGDPIDRELHGVHRDGEPAAGSGSGQEADHVAVEKRGDVVLQLVPLPRDATAARSRLAGISGMEPTQPREEPRDRAGVESRHQQPSHRLAVVANGHRPERGRAICRVEPPVLLQLPGQEAEHAGNAR